jgi:hypothetical protein
MPPNDVKRVTETLLELEQAALIRWSAGDPSGFLEISAPEVTYFDPFLPKRLDGIAALQDYYESLRGKIQASNSKLLNPKVQLHEPVAILTYNFTCTVPPGRELHWNCSEVFRETELGWRIIQTHWSQTK